LGLTTVPIIGMWIFLVLVVVCQVLTAAWVGSLLQSLMAMRINIYCRTFLDMKLS